MKFQFVMKTKILRIFCFKYSYLVLRYVFILLTNVQMPALVGILTLMSRMNVMLIYVEHEERLRTLGPGLDHDFVILNGIWK